jgi:secreted Zn-dependent insulinase-like peptidase
LKFGPKQEFPVKIDLPIPHCGFHFKQDDTFNSPKLHVCLKLVTPHPGTITLDIFKALFVKLLNERLREKGYLAGLAGISYDVSETKTGLDLTLSSYNDNGELFLDVIFSELYTEDSLNHFKDKHEQLLRAIKNQKHQEGNKLVKKLLNLEVTNFHHPNEEKLKVCEEFTEEIFKEQSINWLKEIETEWLIQGHLTLEHALKIVT